MKSIRRKIIVDATAEKSFEVFLHELGNWWPKEYTWSKEELVALRVNPTVNGFFTEIGPYGFQCDWGRITEISDNKVVFYWQISPERTPEPNPERASQVELSFTQEKNYTVILLEHRAFENHGEKGESYQQMMNSPEGWDYLLAAFVEYLLVR
ncbi:SRPBCC domain-containing protein [Olivibacter sp. SDN3]|uniref:SRPBCC domain-containing protein n=1 Tax=Olivibacter sp. SDN3 TaxID=2764720 RepID=UPI0016515EA1|nr:SRPBCC domain-containing protein [Olivibacter sp. SDN3]QNL49870.1 SRPBCC domain-containing protein [Olivibacter sp. SDN3]